MGKPKDYVGGLVECLDGLRLRGPGFDSLFRESFSENLLFQNGSALVYLELFFTKEWFKQYT